MTLSFDHVTLGQRVIFGAGSATSGVHRALSEFGARRALVIGGSSAREAVEDLMSLEEVVHSSVGVTQHVPTAAVEEGHRVIRRTGADALVSVGGGSATGLAKALGRDTGLPIIAVPTTFSGSEATDVWGQTERGVKTTGTSPRSLPRVVVYDPQLLEHLPLEQALASGSNAVAHAVDALWAPRADPLNKSAAAEALTTLAPGLRLMASGATGTDVIAPILFGSYLAAVAFASAGSGLHHKICHVLGGAFGLEHAGTHAAVLPHVAAWNLPAVPDAESRISAALGSESAMTGLLALQRDLRVPTSLRELGLGQGDVPTAVRAILPQVPPSNPRGVSAADLGRLLARAWAGVTPVED